MGILLKIVKKREKKKDKASDAKRGSRKEKSVRKSRYANARLMLENCISI